MRTYKVVTRIERLWVLLGFGLCVAVLAGCGGGGAGKGAMVDTGPLLLPLPAGHGLAAGQFSIPAGASEEHGNGVISCPAAGPACVVTVADDGSATYERTGGIPTFRIVLMPGPGLSVSDTTPVVASTDADTLQASFDDPANVFPALNATLYRAEAQGSEGSTLSTDFAVNSIQTGVPGEYVIRYTLDGTPGVVTITPNELRSENPDLYRIEVDGTRFDFWFKTQTRNEPFSQYMDSALLGRRLVGTEQHRAWFIFGARTETVPPTGSATYRGRFEARAYRADNPDHDERQHITGAMRLVANFDLNQLQGTIDAIRKRNRDYRGTATDWTTSSFQITDGRIANGQFTATLIGKDSDPNASFDESLKDFTGSILGEFYGPNADEVGAVVAAERTAVGAEFGRSLYGYVAGKNIEPFRHEAATTGLEPLAGRVYGSGTKALIVMLHGTVSSGGPSDYMYRRAEEIANRLPDATVVAVLAPGYYDREGRVSPGSNHERFDFNTPENNDLLAITIQNLKRQLSPENVIAVGHSAGARELGVIVGRYEDLVDGVVLAGGRYRQGSRILSEIPLDFIDTFDRSVKVVALTGTHDESVPPEESLNYVRRLKELGVDARLVLVKGADHGWSHVHDASVAAIGGLLNELEPGLGESLIDEPRLDAAALMTGVDRDRNAHSTAFSTREMPTVESTDDGFTITYVVDGQTQTVELSGTDFGANPSRSQSYSKTTDGTEFRLGIFDKEFDHLDISSWTINATSSSSFGHIIYGARTRDMPTTGMATYKGDVRAIEWPTDAAVRSSSPLVTRFRGDLSLTANFGNSIISGNITDLESRPGDGSSYTGVSGDLSFNGTIEGSGISARDLSGSGVLARFRDGSVNGAFYGAGAVEVGGVFEAADTASNRLLNGYFAGERQ